MRLATAILAAAIALAILWYSASPWWTLSRLREAARTGNSGELARYVDFAEVSARHRRAVRILTRSVLESVRPDTDAGRRFRAFAAGRQADSEIAISEADIRPWLAELPVRFMGFAGEDHGHGLYLARDGLSGFDVLYRGGSVETSPLLRFRREGLGWRLVEVRWGQQ